VDPQPWSGGALAGKLVAWPYGGRKFAVIEEKGIGAHGNPHRGWHGAAECQNWLTTNGKNKAESSSSGAICLRRGAKLERRMSAVRNGGAPRWLL
jgi:hypothetical protein